MHILIFFVTMKVTKTYMSKGSIDALSLMRETEREREIQKYKRNKILLYVWKYGSIHEIRTTLIRIKIFFPRVSVY